MIIESKRIGRIEVQDDKIIHFREGLLGFPNLARFIVADDPSDLTMPFKWLVSIENPELMFLVTDPGIFFKDYSFAVSNDDQKFLGAESHEDVSVLTILTVPENPREITANLRGPLVVNWKTFVGKQIVLNEKDYTTKHFIFDQNVLASTQQKSMETTVNLNTNLLPLVPSTELELGVGSSS